MVQAEWLPNRIHTYTRKITARAEVCSILAAHYGAMDSTTWSLCQRGTLHTAVAFVHDDFAASGSTMSRGTVLAQGRKLLSFCLNLL